MPPLHFGGKNNSSRRNPSLVLGVLVTLLKQTKPGVTRQCDGESHLTLTGQRSAPGRSETSCCESALIDRWLPSEYFSPPSGLFLCVLYFNVFCFACNLLLLRGGLKTVLLRHGSGRLPELSHDDVSMSFHLYKSLSHLRATRENTFRTHQPQPVTNNFKSSAANK